MNYVVAAPWNPEDPSSALCVYAYGGEIRQNETPEQAQAFLEYVKRKGGDRDWAVYEVTFTRVDAAIRKDTP